MTPQTPALIIVVPLLAAFAVSGASWLAPRLCLPLAVAGLGVAAASSLHLVVRVLGEGILRYRLGGWEAPWGILYHVDHLNALVLGVVSLAALLNLVATRQSISKDFPDRTGAFATLYLLCATGLMGMVVTGDLFNLYVLLEVASLSSYAMIGLGKGRAPLASLNYLLMGTVGGCFYLLGVGYLYITTGSLNMADVAALLPSLYGSKAVLVAFLFCLVGVLIKMAFFPLHWWLPNAYAFAPPAVASLLAPLMTKVMVYVMLRLMLTVFTPAYIFEALHLTHPMVGLSCLAIVVGGLLALGQKDLRKMLAYILISEIGYMVGGAWLGNRAGMTGAVLHILNDAVMTLCVFLAVGNITYRLGPPRLRDLGGLFQKMPLTAACLLAGGLGIIGIPPSCGFFSKWYLLSGAIQAGAYAFAGALILSSLLNAALFFRVIEAAYFQEGHAADTPPRMEAPVGMTAPLLVAAAAVLVVGLFTGRLVGALILPILPAGLSG